ncbi:MAG: ABC transporter substrate-binding protein [Trueperaceae bacterium]
MCDVRDDLGFDSRSPCVPTMRWTRRTDVGRADGLSWTFEPREGVMFHDGQEMTSEDVLASYDRLMRVGARRGEFDRITSVEAIDDHTVVFHTDAPWGALPETFSMPSGGFMVHPASVVDELGDDMMGITDVDLMIGTGPYAVEEVIPNERVSFVRFDDYQQPSGDISGWAGPRGQYLDRIVILPITDEATRSLALFAGEVDIADQLPPEDFARLEGDPNTDGIYREPGRRTYLKMNSQQGPFTDPMLRRAVQVAIDLEEAMFTQGPQEAWRTNAFFRYQEGQWMWDGEIMDQFYEADLERGRELVEQSSYDGEVIRYLTHPDLPDGFRPTTTVVLELLQDLGLDAELMVVDGATFSQVRQDLGA